MQTPAAVLLLCAIVASVCAHEIVFNNVDNRCPVLPTGESYVYSIQKESVTSNKLTSVVAMKTNVCRFGLYNGGSYKVYCQRGVITYQWWHMTPDCTGQVGIVHKIDASKTPQGPPGELLQQPGDLQLLTCDVDSVLTYDVSELDLAFLVQDQDCQAAANNVFPQSYWFVKSNTSVYGYNGFRFIAFTSSLVSFSNWDGSDPMTNYTLTDNCVSVTDQNILIAVLYYGAGFREVALDIKANTRSNEHSMDWPESDWPVVITFFSLLPLCVVLFGLGHAFSGG